MTSRILGIVLLIGVIAFVVYWFSQESYGKISDNAYQLATATFGACKAKSVERLDKIDELLEDESFSSQMTKQEIAWFTKLIDRARNGNWEGAAKSAEQMMKEQISY